MTKLPVLWCVQNRLINSSPNLNQTLFKFAQWSCSLQNSSTDLRYNLKTSNWKKKCFKMFYYWKTATATHHAIQWNLVIPRTSGPWKLPCYIIRYLIISGLKENEPEPEKSLFNERVFVTSQPFITRFHYTVEPRYNEVLGTMKITLLYQVSHYIRVKEQRNIKSWD